MSSSPGVIDRDIRTRHPGSGKGCKAMDHHVTCLLYTVTPPTPFSPTMGCPFSLGKYLRVPASWAMEILFHVDVRDAYAGLPFGGREG